MREQITNTKIDLRLLFMKSTLRRKSEYLTAKEKVLFECKECKTQYNRRWGQIVKKNGVCPNCYSKIRTRKTKEETKTLFIEKTTRDGFEIVGEFINTRTKILCKKNGYLYEILPYSYLYDNTVPHRFIGNPHAMGNFKFWMFLNRHDSQEGQIVCDNQEWKATSKKLRFYCYFHDFAYYTTPNNKMASKSKCPKCASKKISEMSIHYSIPEAERNKLEWIETPAIVYTLFCEDEIESFFKIGITTKTVDERYKYGSCIPYKYQIIEEIYTNLYNAIFLEKELQDINKDYSYRPLKHFGGETECFYDLEVKKNIP